MLDQNGNSPVDLSYLHDYTDGDEEAIAELLEIFHETFAEELEKLKENVTDGENNAWAETAHKLKGAAGYVGAQNLQKLCARAQDMKVAAQAERQTLYVDIEANYSNVCDFLKDKAA